MRQSEKLSVGRLRIAIECGRDNVSVLQAEMFVAEEHFNRRSDVAWTPLIHGGEHPGGLGDSELRHPGARRDEPLRGFDLSRVVSGQQPDEDVGVNGAHAAS